MNPRIILLLASMIIILGIHPAEGSPYPGNGPSTRSSAAANIQHDILLSPVFVKNAGQIRDSRILYSLSAGSARLYFDKTGFDIIMPALNQSVSEALGNKLRSQHSNDGFHSIGFRFKNIGGNVAVEPNDLQDERFHYYSQDNPDGITNVAAYKALTYKNVYPNIDAKFYVHDDGLKYEFVVRPGGNVRDIEIEYDGSRALFLNEDGSLSIHHTTGTIRDAAPLSYIHGNAGTDIETRYSISGNSYSFELQPYPADRTLVIDPCIMWSSFVGGGTSDIISDVAADASNNVIITGFTSSIDFPVSPGALQSTSSGSIDAFIVKVDPEGKRLWSTYYGGSGSEDWPRVSTDGSNNILIGGYTSSLDFPVSSGAFQSESGGKIDAFVLKLNSKGKREWATLFGGSFAEECGDIACDSRGNIYLTGSTFSTNLPVTDNALQTSNQGDFDGFASKFDSDGSLLWSTYLGGWSLDYGTGLAINPMGGVAVTGYTESTNFPITSGAYQDEHNGGRYDAFIVSLNANGKRMWTTYYGGADDDQAANIIYGGNGFAYMTGNTKSSDLDCLGNGQNESGGSYDVFLAGFDPQGTIAFSSYYGGAGGEQGTDINVDSKGNIYVCGFKIGDDFPGTESGFEYDTPSSMDAFLIKFDAGGSRLWATAYGGPLGDLAYGIALDDKGNIIMVGETGSKSFPTSGAQLQSTLAGYEDGFLVKFLFYEPLVSAGDNKTSCAEQGIVLQGKISQGVPPYTFKWTPTEGLDDPSSLTPRAVPDETTAYILTVTDAYGCVGNDTVTVVVNERPTVDPGPDRELCPGGSVQIAASVSRGTSPYSFEWSPAAGLSETNGSNVTASPLKTTTYNVLVTDAKGCTHRDSLKVIVLNPPLAVAGNDKTVCKGLGVSIGGEASSGTAPYTYVWTPAVGLSNPLTSSPIASPTKNMSYTVKVRDAKGCTASASVNVMVLPALIIDAGPSQTLCFGEAVSIGGKAKGGKGPYQYTWSPVKGLKDPSSAITSATPDQSTVYTLTVTDAIGCVSTDSIMIAVRDPLIVDAGESKRLCAGSNMFIGSAAAGGLAPYSYSWKPSKGLSSAKAATPTAAPTKTTNYVLTVKDAAGCTARDSITIYVIDVPQPLVMDDVTICQGATVDIKASVKGGTAPYAYAWDPPFGLDAATILSPAATPTQTVTYELTVTDAAGCTGTESVTISVKPVPQLPQGRSISICRGADAEIGAQATGGTAPYRYSWSPESNISSVTSAVTRVRPAKTTTYTLQVVDANGCTVSTSYVIEVLECPSGDAGMDNTMCLGESVQLGGTTRGGLPPYSYKWLPSSGLNSTSIATPTASPANTTAYEFTITDANGCKFRDSVVVSIDKPPIVTLGDDKTICPGAGIELQTEIKGGKKPFEYFWTPAEQLEVSNAAVFRTQPKASTRYSVTVIDANGCSSSDSIMITVTQPLVVDAGEGSTICEGESKVLAIAVQGGQSPYSYSWSGVNKKDKSLRSPTVSPDKSRTFIVSVTDAAGCVMSDSISINVESVAVPKIQIVRNSTACEGDTVILSVNKPYASYAWSTGDSTSSIRITQSTADIRVQVANQRGCTETSKAVSVKFRPRPRPMILVKGEKNFCQGNKTQLRVSGKYASYLWSNGSKKRSISVANSGIYTVRVSDKAGCSGISEPIEIQVYEKPDAGIEQRGDSLIAAEAREYRWLRNNRTIKGASSRSYVPRRSGKYAVELKNENGCKAVSKRINISIPKKK